MISFLLNILVNVFCFVVIFFIGRFNLETAFMFALFVAIFSFKKMDSNIAESNSLEDSKDSKIVMNILYQCVIALFCASIINTNETQKYIIVSILALFFIRIYDFYKPSFIGRFYNFNTQDFKQHTALESKQDAKQDSINLADSNNKNKKTTLLQNIAFYRILSAIINGVLSAISALIALKLLENFGITKYISTILV